MSTNQKAAPASNVTSEKKPFFSVGAIWPTSSGKVPFAGVVDQALVETLVEAGKLEAPPEGKEWKLFTANKASKAGKPYVSIYFGLSDKR